MQALSMLGGTPNGLGSSGLSPWHHISDIKDPGSLVHQSVGIGPPPPSGMMLASTAGGGGGLVHGSSVRGLHQGSVGIHPDCSGSGSGAGGTGGSGSQMGMTVGGASINNNNGGAQHQQHHHHHHHQNSGQFHQTIDALCLIIFED